VECDNSELKLDSLYGSVESCLSDLGGFILPIDTGVSLLNDIWFVGLNKAVGGVGCAGASGVG